MGNGRGGPIAAVRRFPNGISLRVKTRTSFGLPPSRHTEAPALNESTSLSGHTIALERIIHAVKAFARVPLNSDAIEQGASALLKQIEPFTDERVLYRPGELSREAKVALVNLEYRLENVVQAVRELDKDGERRRGGDSLSFPESFRKEMLMVLREARYEGKRVLCWLSETVHSPFSPSPLFQTIFGLQPLLLSNSLYTQLSSN